MTCRGLHRLKREVSFCQTSRFFSASVADKFASFFDGLWSSLSFPSASATASFSFHPVLCLLRRLLLLLGLLGCLLGEVLDGIDPMDRAVVPDCSALALVSAGQLLEPAPPAVDGSETFLGPQLHPAGFIGMATPDAAQKAG